jgi:hypothetical protein
MKSTLALVLAAAALLLAAYALWRRPPPAPTILPPAISVPPVHPAPAAPPAPPAGSGVWLQGDVGAKFDQLATQARGLDVAMWEVGYRYLELGWAGERTDWDYARYQAAKIRLALELALVRRPKRAANSRLFLDAGLAPMERLLQEPVPPAPAAFAAAQSALLGACIACHAQEQAPILDLAAWVSTHAAGPRR